MKQYIVDAFTDTVFKGNPAAVCLLEQWLPDALLQEIAKENNLSETAFTVGEDGNYSLRWFTPGGEIDLCGHATLASAYVLTHFAEPGREDISFHTKSGLLRVVKKEDCYEMELPAYELAGVPVTDQMEQAIGYRPVEAWMGRDLVCVLSNEEQVRGAVPDENAVRKLDGLLLHLTARGEEYDCVTRSFAPKLQVSEDPVCGSGHCHVIPLWSKKLKKNALCAFQASARTGVLYCSMEDQVVRLSGMAALFAAGEIYLPEYKGSRGD